MTKSANGIIVINKPASITSHDVVAKLRKLSGIQKIGHTGTLDPMATGVMVMLVGKATRISQYLNLEPKVYRAEALFGISTSTQDITGEVLIEKQKIVSQAEIEKLLPKFTGVIDQVPPMVSAIKVDGTPLYKLARKGQEIERTPRKVQIFDLTLEDLTEREGKSVATFLVTCSGGTYIRTLVHDIGEVLGCGGTLAALQRRQVGNYSISEAIDLSSMTDISIFNSSIISMKEALSYLSIAIVDEQDQKAVEHGNPIAVQLENPGDFACIQNQEGVILAIAQIKKTDNKRYVLQPKVVLV